MGYFKKLVSKNLIYLFFIISFVTVAVLTGCGGSEDSYNFVSGEEQDVKKYTDVCRSFTEKVSSDGKILVYSKGDSQAVLEAKEENTLPSGTEVTLIERGLYANEVDIYGDKSTNVFSVIAEKTEDGLTRKIKEFEKPLIITLPNKFSSEYSDFWLAYKPQNAAAWEYSKVDASGHASMGSARFSVDRPQNFVFELYRSDYCFTVFAANKSQSGPEDDPTKPVDPVKPVADIGGVVNVTQTALPLSYRTKTYSNGVEFFEDNVVFASLIEAEKSSEIFTNASVTMELTYFSDSASLSGLKINGMKADETVTDTGLEHCYMHRFTVKNFSSGNYESLGILATYSFTLNTKNTDANGFADNLRLKTYFAAVNRAVYSKETVIKRTKEVAEPPKPVVISYEVIEPAIVSNVATDTSIVIQFSEAIAWSGELAKNLILSSDKYTEIHVNYSWSDDFTRLTVTPDSALKYNSQHTFSITTTLKAKNSDNYLEPLKVVFATIAGQNAKAALTLSPYKCVDGLYCIDSGFSVDFGKQVASSEEIKNYISMKSGSVIVDFDMELESNNRVANMTPSALLTPDSRYSISMSSGMKDTEGLDILPFEELSFTTLPDISITETMPEAGQTDVATDTEIVVTFSHGIDWNSDSKNKIHVKDSSGSEIRFGEPVFDKSTNKLTITLSYALLYNSEYFVSIDGGLVNTATKQKSLPCEFSFITADTEKVSATAVISAECILNGDLFPILVNLEGVSVEIDFVKQPLDYDAAADSVIVLGSPDIHWQKIWNGNKLLIKPIEEKLPIDEIFSISMNDDVYDKNNGKISRIQPVVFHSNYFLGNGTDEDPYLIYNARQVDCIRFGLSKVYKLMDNIDFADYTSSLCDDYETAYFMPIGTELNPFTGKLIGNNKAISNFKIQRDEYNVGLFGYAENARFENLTLDGDGFVNGGENVGALVGTAMTTEFENITNSIHVGGIEWVGGICGSGFTVKIRNCSNTAPVTNIEDSHEAGDYYDFAGICGYAETDSEFVGCSNSGNITGVYMVGGIVGECYDNCTFDHCFNEGRITSEESGSGIVDYAEFARIMCCYNEGETDCGGGSGGISSCLMGSDLSNCYNTGDIYACKVFDGTDVGGIVGYAQDSNVSNCYVDCVVSDDKEYSMIVSSVYGGSFVDCFATERSVKICNGVSAPVEYPSQILDPIHLANGAIFSGFNVLNLGTSSDIAGAPYWETTGWNDTSIWTLYSDKPPTLVP